MESCFAWVLTILSVYSGIQVFGFMKSMFKRPISIDNGRLYLRYGIMSESTIEINNIASIEVASKEIEFDNEIRKFSILGSLEEHNVIIHLSEENTLTRLYGIQRKYKSLAIYVDDKSQFAKQINDLRTL